MLSRAQKIQQVDWLTEQFLNKSSAILASYKGLNIADMTDLRRRLKKQGIVFKVIKSALLTIALRKQGIELSQETVSLPLAAAFSDDEVAPAKLLVAFSKDHEALRIVGGVVEKKLVGVSEIKSLASLPSREELDARIVGALRSPSYRFVNALRYPLSGFVGVLKQKLSN